jgi:acyl-coenzyme A synthetase/AMP-(fatty) acid ligase
VASILAELAPPRWLVTVPMHIAACVAMGTKLPSLAGILSATAPLDPALARAFEGQAGAPLCEIYGSTEAGAVGTREPARETTFRLLDGLRLHAEGGLWRVDGGHVGDPAPLHDQLAMRAPDHFQVGARAGDLVKIGGKRGSIVALNALLLRIPGVVDGVFWLPDPDRGTPRMMAFVVAPGVARDTVLAALRERIDPAFLPRPLIVVDALPRDALGKLPRARMAELATRALESDFSRPL